MDSLTVSSRFAVKAIQFVKSDSVESNQFGFSYEEQGAFAIRAAVSLLIMVLELQEAHRRSYSDTVSSDLLLHLPRPAVSLLPSKKK